MQRAENPRNSPYGYEFDYTTLFAVNDLDDEGYQVATYHSHPRSPAEPFADGHQPRPTTRDWLYLIVSLEAEPVVRAWWIRDGRVEEEELDVIDG